MMREIRDSLVDYADGYAKAREKLRGEMVRIYRPNEVARYSPLTISNLAVREAKKVQQRISRLSSFAYHFNRPTILPIYSGEVIDEEEGQLELKIFESEVSGGVNAKIVWDLGRELELLMGNPNRNQDIFPLLFTVLKKGEFRRSLPGVVRGSGNLYYE